MSQSAVREIVSNNAVLYLPDGQTIELPVLTGSENEKAIDIGKLRSQTGHITLDPGYGNTGSCQSKITFLDGEKGILRYRGIPIEQLADKASFVEVAYLIIYGNLPNQKELSAFTEELNHHAMLSASLSPTIARWCLWRHPAGIVPRINCRPLKKKSCFDTAITHSARLSRRWNQI